MDKTLSNSNTRSNRTSIEKELFLATNILQNTKAITSNKTGTEEVGISRTTKTTLATTRKLINKQINPSKFKFNLFR